VAIFATSRCGDFRHSALWRFSPLATMAFCHARNARPGPANRSAAFLQPAGTPHFATRKDSDRKPHATHKQPSRPPQLSPHKAASAERHLSPTHVRPIAADWCSRMTRIDGPGPATPASVTARGARRPGTFVVSGPDMAAEAAEAAPSAVSASAGLSGLLALQSGDLVDAGADTIHDRTVRRRARDILDALAALQRAMLTDGPITAPLERLAILAQDGADAADPTLRATMDAIMLRARVELARHAAI